MTVDDISAADNLRRLIGWNQRPEHWRRLLQLEPEGCFVVSLNGQLVGTVTTTSYGTAMAWIGMMLVHPDHRRRGIATRLMQQSVDYLHSRGVNCIRLDATPAGFPLYQQLGFMSEWTLTRWQRGGNAKNDFCMDKVGEARALREADWSAIEGIDSAAFGVKRTQLIRSLAGESIKALVWPAQGAVEGYGLLRPGPNADYLGPVICRTNEGSVSLASALLGGPANRPIFWDVPDDNAAAKSTAEGLGFTPQRPLTRMRLGPDSVRSDPQAQFAIADPAVG